MKKARCEDGHFFDIDRYPVCPLCGQSGAPLDTAARKPVNTVSARKTEILWTAPEEEPAAESPPGPTAPERFGSLAPVTTSVPAPTGDPAEDELPVAWLVGLSHPYLGNSFACRTGRTRIGRSAQMEIALPDAPSVSEEFHAAVIYEPVKREFFLEAGTGTSLTYRNGNLVFSHDTLYPYDRIRLGGVEFVFLPLCGERFSWENLKEQGWQQK